MGAKSLFVYYDGFDVNKPTLMGVLSCASLRGKEVFSFEYDRDWLRDKQFSSFDPDLMMFEGRQYLPEGKENFGIFLDSSPDRWGRVLLDRREAIRAKEENRTPQYLMESDYLLGVFDESRMGALRFKLSPDGKFLDNDGSLAAPPMASLRELETASLHIEEEDNLQAGKWLKVLVAPGSSLGGARPKANVRDPKGALWIAKFPSSKDRRDVGAWERLCMLLARQAGITVSDSAMQRYGSGYHTFLTRRFDRTEGGGRVMFASAMTLLGYSDGAQSVGASYLELAEWITRNCRDVEENLQELFKRIAFNIAVSNCDDHLRNHGFLYTKKGWTLSPAYDLNPDPSGKGLSLNITENDNSLDFDLLMEVAPFYGIDASSARSIIEKVKFATSNWRAVASDLHIPRDEQELMAVAF